MIPKIIHYCWFGGKAKPRDVERNLSTWHKYCPDYIIKEWNEKNYDIHINRYCEDAYENRQWAFVSDVARLYALVHEGGIYMDTDVEVVKSFDDLLDNRAFLGFEGTKWIATSAMGTEPNNPILKYFFESYNDLEFVYKVGFVDFVQDNESKSSYGVMRGLHFQKPPYTQAKLVRCVRGAVLDVAVDLRKDSPTYGNHVAVELTAVYTEGICARFLSLE